MILAHCVQTCVVRVRVENFSSFGSSRGPELTGLVNLHLACGSSMQLLNYKIVFMLVEGINLFVTYLLLLPNVSL